MSDSAAPGGPQPEDARSRRVVRGHVAAMIVSPVAAALPWGRLAVDGVASHIAGGAVAGLGGALMLWTLAHLGRATRAQIAPLSRLVTSGPFSFVRHPYYTGITLVLYGHALWQASALGLVAVSLVLVPIQLRRIRLEEQALAVAFGPAWEAYANRTGRLLPRRPT